MTDIRHQLRRLAISLLSAAAILTSAQRVAAQSPTYAVQDHGGELAPGSSSFAHAVSEDGDACGEAWVGATRVPFFGS